MGVLTNFTFRNIIVAFGLVLILSGCGDAFRGQSFDVPVSEAREILKRTEVPYDVLGSPDLRSTVIEKSPTTLVWKVTLDGSEFMQFTAEVTPNNPKSTHVVVSLNGPSGGKYAAMEKTLNDNVTVKNLYLAAMEEEVAAALEKRDFDMMKLTPQIMAAAGANLGTITKRLDDIDQPSQEETQREKRQAMADREIAEWNAGEDDEGFDQ